MQDSYTLYKLVPSEDDSDLPTPVSPCVEA